MIIQQQFNFSFKQGNGIAERIYNFAILAANEEEAKKILRTDLAKIINEVNESL